MDYISDNKTELKMVTLVEDFKFSADKTFQKGESKFIIDKNAIQDLNSRDNIELKSNLYAMYAIMIWKATLNNKFHITLINNNRAVNILNIIDCKDKYNDYLEKAKGVISKSFQDGASCIDESIFSNIIFEIGTNKDVNINSFDIYTKVTFDTDFKLVIQYNASKYSEATIYTLKDIFIKIIEGISENNKVQLGKIKITKNEHIEKIIEEFNKTEFCYPEHKTIHELIHHIAMEKPDNIALIKDNKVMTYRELDEQSNKLANFLLNIKKIKIENKIGIFIDNYFERYISILAILKAGAAYVPFDISIPASRVKTIREDSKCVLMIAQSKFKGLLEDNKIIAPEEIFYIDDKKEEVVISKMENEYPKVDIDSRKLAYVVYTSGSTGIPKGVMLEHRSLVNYSYWFKNKFHLEETDSSIDSTNFAFDGAVIHIFPILMSGGSINITNKEIQTNIEKLNLYMNRNGVTICFLTTNIGEAFMNLDNTSLKLLVVGGEKLNYVKKNSYEILNIYGPTETTVNCTSFLINKEYTNIPIGSPIYNTKVVILDENNNIQPIGIIGEICVMGHGIARGYVNDKKETEKRFIRLPEFKDEVIYKTGDLGRWLPDGNIEYLGRCDNQVKLRGFRIELGEIRAVLMKYSNIKEAAVTLYESNEGVKYIGGCYVCDGKINEEDCKKFLSGYLPEYMIPHRIIKVYELPVNNNGKIDNKKICEKLKNYIKYKEKSETYLEAKNIYQSEIKEIWGRILQIKNISIDEEFFKLGGHSITALQLIHVINEKYNIDMPMGKFFKEPTIENMASIVIEELEIKNNNEKKYIVANEKDRFKPFHLNDLQQAYLIGRQSDFQLGNSVTHCYSEFLCDNYDHERFEKAANRLFKRHDMLRAFFSDEGYQQVLESVENIHIPIEDISEFDEEVKNGYLKVLREELSNKQLDCHKGPLVEARVTKISKESAIVHFYYDGLVVDGWSQEIIFKEMDELYENPDIFLKPLTITYRDYTLYKKEFKLENKYKKSKEYWEERMKGLPDPPDIPIMQSPELIINPKSAQIKTNLELGEWESILRNAKDYGITSFTVILTIFTKVIAYWNRKQNFTISIPEFSRPDIHEDIKNMVGEFASFLLFEVDNKADESVLETMKRNQAQLLEILEYNSFSGVEALREIYKSRGGSNETFTPIVLTSLLNVPRTKIKNFKKIYSSTCTSQVWMDIIVSQYNEKIHFDWDYVENLIPQNILQDMVDAFTSLLKGLVIKENWNKRNYCLIPSYQMDILSNVMNTKKQIEYETIGELLEKSYLKNKNNIALCTPEKQYTYEEIFREVKCLANRLIHIGVKNGDVVTVILGKGEKQLISVLGSVYSGAAYLPLDTEMPNERINYCIKESESKVVIIDNETEKKFRFDNSSASVINIDNFTFNNSSSEFKPVKTELSDPIYLIYTSGSTGNPKGIIIEQKGLINCLLYTNERFKVTEKDRIIALTNLSHDMSVYDIFGILIQGASLVMPENKRVKDPEHWIDLIEKYKVTMWNSVPAMMEMMLQTIEFKKSGDINSLRIAIMGGDYINVTIPGRLKKVSKNIEVVSVGGPSETTLWNIYHVVAEEDEKRKTIPYGKPIWNTKYYILNDNLELCPMGVTGIMYCEGVGVAREYINSEEINNSKFIINPYTGNRIYNTGDLGRYMADGSIEFMGRDDLQIKINGKRIELGEIEYYAMQLDLIEYAIARVDEDDRKTINLYYKSSVDLEYEELRQYFKDKLPIYMIPKNYVRIDKIPLTKNGKIDRKALPKIQKTNITVQNEASDFSELEKELINLYKEIIDIDTLNIEDNFFMLGGDSLKAIKLLHRLNTKYDMDIKLTAIFQNSSVYELSKYIQSYKKDLKAKRTINKVENKEKLPLSYAQQGIWFVDINGDNKRYNLVGTVVINEKLNLDCLNRAIQTIVDNNEQLRLVILEEEREPYQKVLENIKVKLQLEEYPNLEEEEVIQKLEEEEILKKYNLQKGPLFRLRIVRGNNANYILSIAIHHVIADAYSIGIIIDQIKHYYKLYMCKEEVVYKKENISFLDYWLWQKENFDKGDYKKDIEYWKSKLSGELTMLELSNSKNKNWNDFYGNSIDINLNEQTMCKFKEICKSQEMTLFAGFCTALYILLYKLTGEEDLVVGTAISGREISEIKDVIGCFANVVPLRTKLSGEDSFIQISAKTKDTVIGAYNHQALPFEKIMSEINLDRKYFQIPYKVVIDYIDVVQNEEEIGEVSFDSFKYSQLISPQDLGLFIQNINGKHKLDFLYKNSLFDENTVKAFSKLYEDILKKIIKAPNEPIIDYEFGEKLTAEEVKIEEFCF